MCKMRNCFVGVSALVLHIAVPLWECVVCVYGESVVCMCVCWGRGWREREREHGYVYEKPPSILMF